MCIKGFVNRLSHDSDLDIERDVSTAYCRSSSGDRVDLLSRTIYSPVIVSSWMVGGFRTIKVLLVLSEEENVPSEVRSGTVPLLTYTYCKFPHVCCFRKPTALLLCLGCSPYCFSHWAFFWAYRRHLRCPYFLSIYRTGERICYRVFNLDFIAVFYSHFITDGRYFLSWFIDDFQENHIFMIILRITLKLAWNPMEIKLNRFPVFLSYPLRIKIH